MDMKNIFDVLLGLLKKNPNIVNNNYNPNCIRVEFYADGVECESAYRNEYGGLYGNEDTQFFAWSDIPSSISCALQDMAQGETLFIYEEDEEELLTSILKEKI